MPASLPAPCIFREESGMALLLVVDLAREAWGGRGKDTNIRSVPARSSVVLLIQLCRRGHDDPHLQTGTQATQPGSSSTGL